MAGVEALGIVLGVLPLVIEGIKSYKHGITTIKECYQFEPILEEWTRQLSTDLVIFHDNCEAILYGIFTQAECQTLLADPGGAVWYDREIDFQGRMQQRLGGGMFECWMAAVKAMMDRVEVMKTKLSLTDDGKATWFRTKKSLSGRKKVKLALSKDEYEKLLEAIRKINSDINTLTAHSLAREARSNSISSNKSPQSKSSINIETYNRIRHHAKSLYNVICSHFGDACGCGLPHQAGLKLDLRRTVKSLLANGQAGKNASAANTTFSLAFSSNHLVEKGSLGGESDTEVLTWAEVEVESRPGGDNKTNQTSQDVSCPSYAEHDMVSSAPPPYTARPTSKDSKIPARPQGSALSRIVSSSTHDRPKKSVAFKDTHSRSTSDSIIPTMNDRQDKPTQSEMIQNLCNSISQASIDGYLPDTTVNIHHNLRIPRTIHLPTQSHLTSLDDILKSSYSMTKTERLTLGFLLAVAMLELHETPWLPDSWCRKNILFLKNGEKVIVQHPLLVNRFPTLPPLSKGGQAADTMAALSPALLISSPPLFSLGVLLIELWTSQPLYTFHQQYPIPGLPLPAPDNGGDDMPSALTFLRDSVTARALVQQISDDAGVVYGDAVRRCVNCDFDLSCKELSDEKFKTAVWEKVVCPLEEYLEAFAGKGVGELLGK